MRRFDHIDRHSQSECEHEAGEAYDQYGAFISACTAFRAECSRTGVIAIHMPHSRQVHAIESQRSTATRDTNA